jgi:hypothetical protein
VPIWLELVIVDLPIGRLLARNRDSVVEMITGKRNIICYYRSSSDVQHASRDMNTLLAVRPLRFTSSVSCIYGIVHENFNKAVKVIDAFTSP